MDLTSFMSPPFAVASVAVLAVTSAIKRLILAQRPALKDSQSFKAGMVLSNLVVGVVTAVPTGFLAGEKFAQRAILGVCAGYASQLAYHGVVKRLGGKNVDKAE
jgi:hypothetical protein